MIWLVAFLLWKLMIYRNDDLLVLFHFTQVDIILRWLRSLIYNNSIMIVFRCELLLDIEWVDDPVFKLHTSVQKPM